MAGAYPVLLGAGAIATDGWLARGAARTRAVVVSAALGLSAIIGAVIGLSVLPVSALAGSPIMAVNPDAGELVGWPSEVDTVARVWDSLPPAGRAHALIFALNYGEAGALERYGPGRGLPTPYSGHNAFADFAVPPDDAAPVVVIGYKQADLADFFSGCRLAARVDNGYGLDNEEQGHPIWVCQQVRRPWQQMWPDLRHIS
jgi:hypothetical protein